MRLHLGIVVTSLALASSSLAGASFAGTSSSTGVAASTVAAQRGEADELAWKRVNVNTSQNFRGLDAVSAGIAWVSGSAGGVWRTTDAGRTWRNVTPASNKKKPLEFRDVEAINAANAQVLAIGAGRKSRILRTSDGGVTWTKTFVNSEQDAFYDCMAMFDDGIHGLAMSDPVKGKFRIITTHDGGDSWSETKRKGMPKAKTGEFGFAASGTCVAAYGEQRAAFATGGSASRIFRSGNFGRTWRARKTTIPSSEAGGVFSIDFRDDRKGLAVGGDFLVPDEGKKMSARSNNGGWKWKKNGDLGGYRSGVAWLADSGRTAIAVGPSGSDVTTDAGKTWEGFDNDGFDAVQCIDGSCWASGANGVVARLVRR